MNKVLLWGWFGFENLGDDLLLKTMLDHLQGEITVPIQKQYELTPSVHQVDRSYINLLSGALHNDVMIIGPGGLFPFDNKAKVLLYFLIIMFWKLLNRKVIFFGIGISTRMSNFSAFLWRKMAKSADLFIPRSENILKQLDLQNAERCHSMADTVFASNISLNNGSVEGNRIAVSVANLQQGHEELLNDAARIWIEVIKFLLDKGFNVDLIAFTKEKDDRLVEFIVSDPEIFGRNVCPVYYKDVTCAISNWSKYKFAICMRFHSLVLSILANVPAIPIAYGEKTCSLSEQCGLSDYAVIWNNFQCEYYGKKINITPNQVIEKIEQLCASMNSVKEKISAHRNEFIDSASMAFEQLETVLCE